MGYLYLLCFERSLSDKGNAHYLGYAESDPDKRIAQHRTGRARAAFTDEAYRQGIKFQVAAIWPRCTQVDERLIKRQKNHRRYCRICRDGKSIAPVPPMTRREYVKRPVTARTEARPPKAPQTTSARIEAAYDDLEDLPY